MWLAKIWLNWGGDYEVQEAGRIQIGEQGRASVNPHVMKLMNIPKLVTILLALCIAATFKPLRGECHSGFFIGADEDITTSVLGHAPYKLIDAQKVIRDEIQSINNGGLSASFRGTGATSEDLKPLQPDANLKFLDLSFTYIDDSFAPKLAGFPNLVELRITSDHVTSAIYPAIAELKHLKILRLMGRRLEERGIDSLFLLPELRELELQRTAISAIGSSKVLEAKYLTRLHLDNQVISQAEAAQLSSLPHLQILSLTGCGMSLESLLTLCGGCPDLKELRLDGSVVTGNTDHYVPASVIQNGGNSVVIRPGSWQEFSTTAVPAESCMDIIYGLRPTIRSYSTY